MNALTFIIYLPSIIGIFIIALLSAVNQKQQNQAYFSTFGFIASGWLSSLLFTQIAANKAHKYLCGGRTRSPTHHLRICHFMGW